MLSERQDFEEYKNRISGFKIKDYQNSHKIVLEKTTIDYEVEVVFEARQAHHTQVPDYAGELTEYCDFTVILKEKKYS